MYTARIFALRVMDSGHKIEAEHNSGYQWRWCAGVIQSLFYAAAEKLSGLDPDPATPFILLYQIELFQLVDRFD